MEQQIKMAAKLYECRDTAKKLYGAEFENKISYYKRYIKACMMKHNYKDEITAAMRLAKDCEGVQGSGMGVMLIMAACVELIEPSAVV